MDGSGNLLTEKVVQSQEETTLYSRTRKERTTYCMLHRGILILFLGIYLSATASADYSESQAVPEVVKRLTEMYGPATPPKALVPTAQKDPLGHLLALQRRQWAPAWVSSTFYDWRTTSQYRRHAGLHLGYDIALPYGTPVAAAWSGEVVSVVPWTSTEWGVTVQGSDGTETTYGHITPGVSTGKLIAPGDILGRVASDHVDVKMRDRYGRYVPFGEDGLSPGQVMAYPAGPKASRNSILTSWLVAKSSAEQADEELFLAENAKKKWDLEKRSAERTIELLDKTLGQLGDNAVEGLISRKRLEELKAERAQAKRVLDTVAQRKKATPQQIRENQKMSKANLAAIEKWAKSEGLGWKDVEALIYKTIVADKALEKKVVSAKKVSGAPSTTIQELDKQRITGAKRLEQLEKLFAVGGMSRQEIEDERLRQQLLEEEFQLRKRRNSR